MKPTALITLVTLGTFALYGNANAENGHAYNGSFCKSYYGSQVSDFNHLNNGIRNNAGSARFISYPIVVDEIANTNGTTRVWVHYTGTGTVSCNINSMNGNGSFRQARTRNRTNTGWFSMP